MEGGGQVLYLLPEIALTAQIVTRLMRVFGSRLGVYHSKFSDNERVEVWNGVLSGRFQVVVGVRSAVFLPFDNLSLIIVDEEHESSYKQYDPAPRYNAREVALMMANFQGRQNPAGLGHAGRRNLLPGQAGPLRPGFASPSALARPACPI